MTDQVSEGWYVCLICWPRKYASVVRYSKILKREICLTKERVKEILTELIESPYDCGRWLSSSIIKDLSKNWNGENIYTRGLILQLTTEGKVEAHLRIHFRNFSKSSC